MPNRVAWGEGEGGASQDVESTEYLDAKDEARVAALRLEECWSAKPLLDGRAVMETAGCKGGPVMKAFSEKLVDWQLANPEGTPEQARAFVASVAEATKAEFAE